MVVQKRGGADRERTRKILAVELNFVCMLRGGRDTRRAAEPAMCRLCCPQRAGSKRKSGRASGCEWRRETAWMEAAQWRDRRQQATRRATGRCTAWSCASRAGVGTKLCNRLAGLSVRTCSCGLSIQGGRITGCDTMASEQRAQEEGARGPGKRARSSYSRFGSGGRGRLGGGPGQGGSCDGRCSRTVNCVDAIATMRGCEGGGGDGGARWVRREVSEA